MYFKIKIYKTVILSVGLCGCDKRLHSFGTEYSLKVFEKKNPEEIFGNQRNELEEGSDIEVEKLD